MIIKFYRNTRSSNTSIPHPVMYGFKKSETVLRSHLTEFVKMLEKAKGTPERNKSLG
jgi:hypothetical protein